MYGNVTSSAAPTATTMRMPTSALGGMANVLSDAVGMRLTANAAVSIIHEPTAAAEVHQP